jgi:hypothetical protein
VLQNVLQDVLTSLARNQSSRTVHASTFSEVSAKLVGTRRVLAAVSTPASGTDRCTDWKSLLSGDVAVSSQQFNPVGVRLTVADPSGATFAVKCNTPSVVRKIVNGLLNLGDVGVSQLCGGDKWLVGQCPERSAPAICVNCTDPCGGTAYCSPQGSPSYSFALSPCTTTSCTAGTVAPSAARVLNVEYGEQKAAPALLQSNVTSTSTALVVTSKLSAPGYLYCAAYIYPPVATARPEPTSASSVVLQNNVDITNSYNVSVVSISGLPSATDFMVYCATMSTTGALMPLKTILESNLRPRTTCCIPVLVETKMASVEENAKVQDFLQITVNTRPAVDIILSIAVYNLTANHTVQVANEPLFPATFTISALADSKAMTGVKTTPSSQSSALKIQTVRTSSALKPLYAGTYKYVVTVGGSTASQFSVVYPNAKQSIAVIAKSAPLPAPELLAAAFTDDGSVIVIDFDSSTDRGAMPQQFTCSALFVFDCAATARCIWTTPKRVEAYVDAATTCATVGSQIKLVTTAVVKAQCQNGATTCDRQTWLPASTTKVVYVASPLTAISPSVALSSPDTIGQCDPLLLDVTASSGNGGRPWKPRTVTVDTASPDPSLLQSFLANKYQDSPPTPLPSNLFVPGYTYNFVVRLCNFLGKCSQTSKRVLVQDKSIPTVTLPGAAMRYAQRSAPVTIASNAFVLQCDKDVRTSAGLTYSWAVSLNGAPIQLTSMSKDPGRLVIPAFVLQVERVYDVAVTVTMTSSNQATKASTQVYVARGNLVAVVRDGATRTVQEGKLLNIDGSQSYDQDETTAPQLSFTWACAQVLPVYNSDCSDIFSQFNQTLSSNGYTIAARPNTADAVAQITMYILDAGAIRSAEAVVTVTVVPPLAPVVSLRTNIPASGIFNSDRELQLTGTVRIAGGQNGALTWLVSDYAQFSLAAAALSPRELPVPISISAQTYDVSMVLGAYSMPDRAVLTFTLKASTANTYVSTASASVTVNAAPLPGKFSVSPRNGTEIVDPFTFVATQWYDADLPLQYQFGYISNSGAAVALRSKSETAYWTGKLTAGSTINGFAVNCSAQVIDSLEAGRVVYDVVRVQKQGDRDPATVADIISSALIEGAGSTDGLKQATALSTYLLNEVNCTSTPNCTTLNRQECFRTPHTCGACISSLYIGDEGDSNQHCQLRNSTAATIPAGTDCEQASDCGLFQQCVHGLCAPIPKLCPNDCSYPQGNCVRVNADSGESVATCNVGDSSCRAMCNCTASYIGSATCGLNSTELARRQALRSQVIDKVFTLIATENANLQSYQGWVSSLTLATQSTDEVSKESASVILSAAAAVLSSGVAVTPDEAKAVLTPVDAALTALENAALYRRLNGTPHHARRASEEVAVYDTLLQAGEVLRNFTQYVTGSVLPGQYAVEAVLPQVRVLVQKPSVLDLARLHDEPLVVSAPVSTLEKDGYGRDVPRVSLPVHIASEVTSVNITLATVRGELLNAGVGLNGQYQIFSNALDLGLAGLPCDSARDCMFDVVLPTATSMAAYGKVRTGMERFSTKCTAGVNVTAEYVCPDGSLHPVHCDGVTNHVLESTCPLTTYQPTCSALKNLIPSNRTCELIGRTDTNITCRCPLPNSHHVIDELTGNGKAEVSYVAMLVEVKENFADTFRRSGHVSLKKGRVAFMAIGSLTAAILIALLWSHSADAEEAEASKFADKKDEPNKSQRSFRPLEQLSEKVVTLVQKVTGSHDATPTALSPEEQLADESLPSILSSNTLYNRVTTELKRHHRWFCVVFYYTPKFPRTVRVLSLTSNLVVMLFMQAVTYGLMYPDDKSCVDLSQQQCEVADSPYQQGASKCQYNTADGTCTLVQPDVGFYVVVFVAVFSALVATPIGVLTDYIIMEVLTAPTKKPSAVTPLPDAQQPQLAAIEDLGSTSTSVRLIRDKPGKGDLAELVTGDLATLTTGPSCDSPANMSVFKKRTTLRQPMAGFGSFLVGLFNEDHMDIMSGEIAALRAENDFKKLVVDIASYRLMLNTQERAEFDGTHGDVQSEFVSCVCTLFASRTL